MTFQQERIFSTFRGVKVPTYYKLEQETERMETMTKKRDKMRKSGNSRKQKPQPKPKPIPMRSIPKNLHSTSISIFRPTSLIEKYL